MAFMIFQQLDPVTRPYRVAETVQTCDGPRTRLTNHSFKTLQEAQSFVAIAKEGLSGTGQ